MGWGGLFLTLVGRVKNGGIGGGSAEMVDVFGAGHGLGGLGCAAGGISLGTSVRTARAPGMTMRRVPFFSLSALCTAR